MMNAMEEEMERDAYTVVWQVTEESSQHGFFKR